MIKSAALCCFLLLPVAMAVGQNAADTQQAAYHNYQSAHYNGGQDSLNAFIKKNFRYPEAAKDAGVQGRVLVWFIVDEKGHISGAKVIRGIGFGCDKEALRLIAVMPAWIPATNMGKPAKAVTTLPIVFTLE